MAIANSSDAKKHCSYGAADAETIGDFFDQEHIGGGRRSVLFVDPLCNYMRRLPYALPPEQPANAPPVVSPPGTPELAWHEGSPEREVHVQDAKPACLLGYGEFSSRSSLTRHTIRVHIEKGTTFGEPFPCPEWRRLRWEDYIVRSPPEWSIHLGRCHGKQHAPTLYSDKTYVVKAPQIRQARARYAPSIKARTARCFFCAAIYTPGRGFSWHFNREHRNRGLFERPFPCPECRKQEAKLSRNILHQPSSGS